MPYFSDRELGPKPRIAEEISLDAWGGIIAIIQSRITDGSFGYRYPSGCPDGQVPFGCDENSFSQALKAEIPDIAWPLNQRQVPPTLSVLDLLEFCFQAVGKPETIDYHSYYRGSCKSPENAIIVMLNLFQHLIKSLSYETLK